MTDQANKSEIKKSSIEKPETISSSILSKIKMFEPKNTTSQSNRPIGRSLMQQPKTSYKEPTNTVKKEIEPSKESIFQEDKQTRIEETVKQDRLTQMESAIEKNSNNQSEQQNENEMKNQEGLDQDGEYIPISNVYLQELNKTYQSQQNCDPIILDKDETNNKQPLSVTDKIKSIDSKLKQPHNKGKKFKIQPPENCERIISFSTKTGILPETKIEEPQQQQLQLESQQDKVTSIQNNCSIVIEPNQSSINNLVEKEIGNRDKGEKESPNIEVILENKTNHELKESNTMVKETKVKQMSKIFGEVKLTPQDTIQRENTISSSTSGLESIVQEKKHEVPQTEEVGNKAKNILQIAKTMGVPNSKSHLTELDESAMSSISSKQINPINEEIFLSPVEIPIEITNESFCEGFFIATIPKDKGKVVENSEGFIASCSHLICSDLPGMQPEIIYRYPEKDTKTLELNNLAASICFPTGIKICYEQQDPIAVKNFASPITNQQGDRYYMMTYHFFYKMLNCEFVKTYSVYPLKSQMMKFCSDFSDKIELDKKTRIKIDEQLEQCQELNFRDIVYVPFCICLISKYPYLREMEHALESLRIQLSNYRSTSEEIVKLVSYLINSIPIPSLNSKLMFSLPHSNQMHEISCPRYLDMNFLNKNLYCILNVLSIENIILIFRLIIFEQKILFVDNEYNRLSEITEGFASLIYPFQ